jgi:hypothetical protein
VFDDFNTDKELEEAREQMIYKEFEGESPALKHVQSKYVR